MQLDFAHLEGGCMAVPHQVANQSAVFANVFGSRPVGNPRRLDDRRVGAHGIDDADEAVVEHAEGDAQEGVDRCDGRA